MILRPICGDRVGLREALDDLAFAYLRPVGDAVHVRRIVALTDCLTREHLRALVRGRFRIGPAQKARKVTAPSTRSSWARCRIATG